MKLLRPETSSKGGRHPYMIFTDADVRTTEVIRVGQALGLTLGELAQLREARRTGRMQVAQRIVLMKQQLVRLEAKAAEIRRLKAYVRAKIRWQEHGEPGREPRLSRGAT